MDREADPRERFGERRQRRASQVVEPRRPDDADAPRLLAHRSHALRVGTRRDEVEVAQLRHGVPDRLVDEAFGRFAAVEVRDRHPEQRGDGRDRKQLVAIAEDDHELRPEAGERPGQARRHPARATSDVLLGAGADVDTDLGGGDEAVRSNPSVRRAVLSREVHPGDDQLEPHAGITLELAKDPVQQAVVRATCRDDRDAPPGHG